MLWCLCWWWVGVFQQGMSTWSPVLGRKWCLCGLLPLPFFLNFFCWETSQMWAHCIGDHLCVADIISVSLLLPWTNFCPVPSVQFLQLTLLGCLWQGVSSVNPSPISHHLELFLLYIVPCVSLSEDLWFHNRTVFSLCLC